ncbi:hypothetical protein RCO27_06215 [Sphingosinicella sp. LHD-64]|uniref:hypothetical protein n=1 Tax=Sphingosinicella sp. LHD-64 TaxID=3072139 RepID=UPI00280FA87B|nr:hypothetical protein [Sphingosinicella sp. LHD-64]MDQ8755819.1 hypothetical protein [Sphingosinicella sp. LHD-64]
MSLNERHSSRLANRLFKLQRLSPRGEVMPLPKNLQQSQIERAVEYIEKGATELVDLYWEQANIFSAVIGILGIRALDVFSPYKRHKHPDIAQQRFPDLSLGGKLNPSPSEALESKGSSRDWPIQSHYNHPGWYIVWRYLVDETKTIRPDRSVVIWRVDVAFLETEDWKYEGSRAGASQGGRTHTFGLRKPATKLRDAAAYALPDIELRGGKPVLV